MNFRSEKIKLCQLIVHRDAAFRCVVEVGKKPYVQFNDLNEALSVSQRTHVAEIRRFTEIERSLRYLENEIVNAGAKEHIAALEVKNTETAPQRQINDLETQVFELEKDIRQFLENEGKMQKNYNMAREFLHVLKKVDTFFEVHIENEALTELYDKSEINPVNELGTALTPLIGDETTPWFIAGTLEAVKRTAFERVLWRACRRTAFVRTAEINEVFDDPYTGKSTQKCVFIIFFKGQKLQDIVNRVCDGFNARQYNCPKSSRERQMVIADVTIRLHDLKTVIDTSEDQKMQLMKNAAYDLPEWQRQIHIQKTVFHTLNKFRYDSSGNFGIAECWIPEIYLEEVREALQSGTAAAGTSIRPIINVMATDETPPTFNRTNKFTEVFQNIVDSYGVACYREMNPAPYTIISFPFLFAMMFGDVGHALIMLLAAIGFVAYEKKLIAKRINDEIFNAFFGGRYIILLMGIFSVYTGLIYNDAFSKSFNVFGSGWVNPYSIEDLQKWENKTTILPQLDPKDAFKHAEGPYPFGIDPIWNFSNNRLNFINSLKMKASVIVGIAQMTLGIIISFFNFKHQRSYADIFTTFIPQMIFMSTIFVYLCIQIFLKWIYFWVVPAEVFGQTYPGPHCAPSLLIGLINMFMFKPRNDSFIDSNGHEVRQCHLSQWYPNQSLIESVLVITAVTCIPIMLFGKPLCHKIFASKKKRHTRRKAPPMKVRVQVESEEIELIPAEGTNGKVIEEPHIEETHDEHGGADLMVHQAIHTIEFVLGCISHTASYLRLWALSLAHAQLSEVMWHMVLAPGFTVDGPIGAVVLFFLFFIFLVMTIAILVLMEGLSAFLHAIRLHWVEFQSKFYIGTGHAFIPFSLKSELEKFRNDSEVTG
uniref:V-type proton ATPase subunit a n=1 Tax=Panagrellus redivivus TaxID=6233 RepID=A0A7E4W610_PANRE